MCPLDPRKTFYKLKASQPIVQVTSYELYYVRHMVVSSTELVNFRKPSRWPGGPSQAPLAEGLDLQGNKQYPKDHNNRTG